MSPRLLPGAVEDGDGLEAVEPLRVALDLAALTSGAPGGGVQLRHLLDHLLHLTAQIDQLTTHRLQRATKLRAYRCQGQCRELICFLAKVRVIYNAWVGRGEGFRKFCGRGKFREIVPDEVLRGELASLHLVKLLQAEVAGEMYAEENIRDVLENLVHLPREI